MTWISLKIPKFTVWRSQSLEIQKPNSLISSDLNLLFMYTLETEDTTLREQWDFLFSLRAAPHSSRNKYYNLLLILENN